MVVTAITWSGSVAWRIPRKKPTARTERNSIMHSMCRERFETRQLYWDELGAPSIEYGGGRGIRTPGTLSGTAVFKTACFNHSHIPPHGRAADHLRLGLVYNRFRGNE